MTDHPLKDRRIAYRTLQGRAFGYVYATGPDGVHKVRVRDSRSKTYYFARVWPQDIIRIY